MDLGIRGKKALLSGASRGLGRACALASPPKASMSPSSRAPGTCWSAPARKSRTATGVKVTTVAGDITTKEGRAAALEACPEPDILVNNADGPVPGDFRDWTRDDWIAALDTMMLSHIEMMRLTVDGMMERGFGRIVNIVSRSVKTPQLELGLSNGARSGWSASSPAWRGRPSGAASPINNLLPGIFDSDAQRRHIEGMLEMTGKSFDQIWRERAAANPAKRYGDPKELGALCAFLCSANAGYITGQILVIDGGSYPGTY